MAAPAERREQTEGSRGHSRKSPKALQGLQWYFEVEKVERDFLTYLVLAVKDPRSHGQYGATCANTGIHIAHKDVMDAWEEQHQTMWPLKRQPASTVPARS